MFYLFSNMDGRHPTAQVMLAMLRHLLDEDFGGEPFVNFWDRPRSKGYIVSLEKNNRQINLALIQSTDSDRPIVAEFNSIPIQHVEASDCPEESAQGWSARTFSHHEIYEAAEHVKLMLLRFWRDN